MLKISLIEEENVNASMTTGAATTMTPQGAHLSPEPFPPAKSIALFCITTDFVPKHLVLLKKSYLKPRFPSDNYDIIQLFELKIILKISL